MSFLAESFLLILCGLLAGTVGAALTHWNILRVLRMLEYRLEDLDGRVVREVKIRASEKSREVKGADKNLELWAAEQKPDTSIKAPSFMDWRQSKMSGK
jgi:hypothetical protein